MGLLIFQQVQKYEKGMNRVSAGRLQAMSDILQIPLSFFFGGAHIAGPVHQGAKESSPAYVSEFLANPDGLKLVGAFTRIGDAELRRSLVDFVEAAASNGDNRQAPAALLELIGASKALGLAVFLQCNMSLLAHRVGFRCPFPMAALGT